MKSLERKKDEKLWDYYRKTTIKNTLKDARPRLEILFSLIKRFVPEKGKILEIGFGAGYLLIRLKKYYKCYASDISKANIDFLKPKLKTIHFDLTKEDGSLSYKDNFFDGFVASEVLEHMTDEELMLITKEIGRIVKPGGHIFLSFPAEEDLKVNECHCPHCGLNFHRYGHKQFWDVAKIKKIFKNFEVILINRKLIRSGGLNIFGKISFYFQKFLASITRKPVAGMRFIIVLKKIKK